MFPYVPPQVRVPYVIFVGWGFRTLTRQLGGAPVTSPHNKKPRVGHRREGTTSSRAVSLLEFNLRCG
jgi:hypothetical protein